MKQKAIKSSLIALGLIMFGAQSCKDYLKEELVSGVSASSYYSTVAGLEDAVDATYSFLRDIHSDERAYTLSIFGTDTHTNGADGGHKAFNYYDNTLNAASPIVNETWTFLYRGINQANAVLGRSLALNPPPANLLVRQAEVRFLRAYYYFYLVQTWGNVHLTLEETIGAQVTANKTPASQIYSQAIIPDLEFAVANLPVTQSQYGRATRTAAQFLLAKAHLTRGWQSYGTPADFTTAEGLFTSVLAAPGVGLVANHADLWNQDRQLNTEVIWAVMYSNDLILNGGDTGVGNRGHLYFGMEYDIQPGMIRDIANGRPFKRFAPTAYLRGLWAAGRDNDNRYESTYKHAWISNDNRTSGNSIPKWKQIHVDQGAKKRNGQLVTAADIGTNRFAIGDTALYIPGPGREANWLADQKLKVRYTVITSTQASYAASTLPPANSNFYPRDPFFFNERLFPVVSKFFDPRRPTIQWERGSRDFFLFRAADAYLLRAEARFKLANDAGALADINFVRSRAAKPGRVAQMQLVGPVTIDMILDERAMEMDAEQCRWFDLVRTQTLVSRVTAYNPQAHVGGTLAGAPNIQTYHIRRPIPQPQIDRTVGGYPQNCGYAADGDCGTGG